MKIGVFDSGVGALSVIKAIQKELPSLEIVYKDDREHLPYGSKTVEEIHQLVRPIFRSFIDEGCQVVVVACNTVTTNLIAELRAEFSVPMVGMEPAVMPAAQRTKTGTIAVCATPRTLSSQRYQWLKDEYAAGLKVLEPDCADWAMMIENNSLNHQKIRSEIEAALKQGADEIVLGCTHYHWIEQEVKDIAGGRAEVIQPEEPVVAQLKKVLGRLAGKT